MILPVFEVCEPVIRRVPCVPGWALRIPRTVRSDCSFDVKTRRKPMYFSCFRVFVVAFFRELCVQTSHFLEFMENAQKSSCMLTLTKRPMRIVCGTRKDG